MKLSIKKKPRLGRGLSSLISVPVPVEPPASAAASEPAAPSPGVESPVEDRPATPADGLVWVEVERIDPNPYQPRKSFDPAALEQLAQSIRQDGVMQPIVLRLAPEGGAGGAGAERFQLIAGERRWRAAQMAGLPRIPAVLRDLDERQVAEWAVIENIQREDLNPLDRADALARLANLFQMTHQQIAERLGLDRTTVTNLLRLQELHPEVQELIRLGSLSAGHGRALLGLIDAESQAALARKAVEGGWSVRMVEAAVRRLSEPLEPTDPAQQAKPAGARSALLEDLQQQIAAQLGTKVQIKPARKKNAGTLQIEYYDLDQFEGLLNRLGVQISRD